MPDKPIWAHAAHKDGKFAGAISATRLPRREIAKWLGDFVVDGFTVTPVYSQEEYLALIKDMPMWSAA